MPGTKNLESYRRRSRNGYQRRRGLGDMTRFYPEWRSFSRHQPEAQARELGVGLEHGRFWPCREEFPRLRVGLVFVLPHVLLKWPFKYFAIILADPLT